MTTAIGHRPRTTFVLPPGWRRRLLRRRPSLFAPTLALLAVLLVAGPALSALRIGTSGAETLTGTTGNDQLTGKEDADILKGLAGNDTYFFGSGFSQSMATGAVGFDTLVEKPTGGIDTVNFRGVQTGSGAHTGFVTVYLIREWATHGSYNKATGPNGEVRFSYTSAGTVVQSVVENAIGGQVRGDHINGGTGPNILQPGGGASDQLSDRGGWNDGAAGLPELPASNDVFKGFAKSTGSNTVADWGGTADVLDMRPFSTDDVYMDTFNADSFEDGNSTQESLQIVFGVDSQVVVLGQFGPYSFWTSALGQQGRIERVIFADTTITDMQTLQRAGVASAEGVSGKQAELAEAAPRLAKEAQALFDPKDLDRGQASRGGNDAGAEIGKGSGSETKAKQEPKAEQDTGERVKHGK